MHTMATAGNVTRRYTGSHQGDDLYNSLIKSHISLYLPSETKRNFREVNRNVHFNGSITCIKTTALMGFCIANL